MFLYLLACSTETVSDLPVPSAEPGVVTPFTPSDHGFVAIHEPMGTTATITDEGLGYAGDDWALWLRPLGFGRADAQTPYGWQGAMLQGERVVAGDDPRLWAVHGASGLEFGLDLAERPAGDGPLAVRLGIDGLSSPYSTGHDVSFDTGTQLVHIDGLVVTDAEGVQVAATMRAVCGDDALDQAGACELSIEVDDTGATYPLVIDPLLTTAPRSAVDKVAAGDPLVITELMVNPTLVADDRGEWIEITNTGSDPVVLDGLALWDDGNNYFQVPAIGASVAPGGTFVFGRRANPSQNGGLQVDLVTSNFFLANTVDDANPDEVVIGLRASDAPCSVSNPCVEIDRVVMDAEWRHDVAGFQPFLPQGASLSLAPGRITADNDLRANWCDGLAPYGTGQFGTPNQPNESCSFDLEFEYTFDLVAGGQASDCTWVRPLLDGTFSTGNRGEGTYQRYTRSNGQTLTWTYLYNGVPQPTHPTVYTGDRLFGSTTWSLGDIVDFDPSIATDGSWASPCAGGGDTGDTGLAAGSALFTQYMEGTSNNKYLEIQNRSGASLTTDGCSVRIYFNGSSTAGAEIFLGVGSLAADEVFVICNSSATVPGSGCDVSTGSLTFNGDDAVELTCNNTTLDVIGQIGFDPGAGWGSGTLSTVDGNLRRDCAVVSGDADGSDAFDPAVEWTALTLDDTSDLGQHVCP